MNQKNKQNKT